jgi:hypothetical protein
MVPAMVPGPVQILDGALRQWHDLDALRRFRRHDIPADTR